jgi:hypothetical protein
MLNIILNVYTVKPVCNGGRMEKEVVSIKKDLWSPCFEKETAVNIPLTNLNFLRLKGKLLFS